MRVLTFLLAVLISFPILAQDTFSIVAVDSITGEVGSAGASCLDDGDIAGGVYIISDLIPGKGAINTQSYWDATNQANATQRMSDGFSPDSIIDWLENNDVTSNAAIRQYGIADFDSLGSPRAAGFTGANCFDYKNHIVGDYYSIQGNILLGQEILDSMEARFLNTQGELAVRLMAALQGANVPGADTRCLAEGVSSQSAFVRVAKPGDSMNNLYMDLLVGSTPFGAEPIDSLQTMFDNWKNPIGIQDYLAEFSVQIIPNPAPKQFTVTTGQDEQARFFMFDLQGKKVMEKLINNNEMIQVPSLTSGAYLYRIEIENQPVSTGRLILE